MADSGTELLAADGDVILVVGPGKKCIRVCSVTLSRASSVFAALFGPQFREGQQARSSSAPVDIALPDDNADDFLFVCRVLRFHAPNLEDMGLENEAKKLLRLAIVVDKYALTTAFMHTSRNLMTIWADSHNEQPFPNHNDTANVSAAAYLFNEPHCFKLATRKLIRDTNAISLVGISECRSETLNHISDLIGRHELDADGCDACRTHGLKYYDTLRQFWGANSSTLRKCVYSKSEYTITDHIGKLRAIDDVYKYGEGYSELCQGCDNAIPDYQFEDIATEAEEKSTGVCLMCVKSNANVLEECKGQH